MACKAIKIKTIIVLDKHHINKDQFNRICEKAIREHGFFD